MSGGSPTIAAAPIRNATPVHGIRFSSPPSSSSSRRVRRVLHRAGAEKQQPLEDAWLSDVQQAGGEPDDRERGHAVAEPEHAEPDADAG